MGSDKRWWSSHLFGHRTVTLQRGKVYQTGSIARFRQECKTLLDIAAAFEPFRHSTDPKYVKLSNTLCIQLRLFQKLVHNVYIGTLQRGKVYQTRSIASWGKQIKAVEAVNKNATIQLFKQSLDPQLTLTCYIEHHSQQVFSETILFEHFVITLEPITRDSYGQILVFFQQSFNAMVFKTEVEFIARIFCRGKFW